MSIYLIQYNYGTKTKSISIWAATGAHSKSGRESRITWKDSSRAAATTATRRGANERETKYPEGTSWGILPAKGFFVRHARNIKFSNIVIKTEQPDIRPDFLKIDVQ